MRLFHGGTIRSFDGTTPRPAAIAVGDDGKVLAIGALDEVRRAAPGAEEVDLGTRCLIPGFIDVHHHYVLGSLLDRIPRVPGEVKNVAGVLDTLRDALARTPGDGWVVVSGATPGNLEEDALPAMAQLDAISTTRPLCALAYSLHEAAVNAKGLEALGGLEAWKSEPKDVPLDRTGKPTGEIREHPVARMLQQWARESIDRDGAVEALTAYGKKIAALGITHVVDPGLGPTEERFLFRGLDQGAVPIGVDYMLASEQGIFMTPGDRIGAGPQPRSKQIKIFVDGGLMVAMSWTGWEILKFSLVLPFKALRDRSMRLIRRALKGDQAAPGPDKRYHSGMKNFATQAELDVFVKRAMDAGLSVAIHASGTEAIEMALNALAQRGPKQPDVPDQLIHFLFPAPGHVKRVKEVGCAVPVQPAMVKGYADEILDTLPAGDFLYWPPLKEMVELGVPCVLSSDAPVAEPSPIAILEAAVNPKHAEGLDPERALAMFTVEAAKVLGKPEKGRLSPGSPADMVVLDRDPVTAGASLGAVRVLETWVGGKKVAG